MIILDYSGICIAAMYSSDSPAEVSENLIRHMILNTIRKYNVTHRDKFGELVIACDNYSWRKTAFPQYKANRTKARAESDLDWTEIYRIFSLVRDELIANFPYRVINIHGAEADDIIGTLVNANHSTQKILIVSSDKDFIQLQKYPSVEQYSPTVKKFIGRKEGKDPVAYLMEHICKGDVGDGIPNIKSGDNTFVDGIRQTPIRASFIEQFKSTHDFTIFPDDIQRNIARNKMLIDLSNTPDAVVSSIISEFEKQEGKRPAGSVFTYLVEKRCALLLSSINDFSPKQSNKNNDGAAFQALKASSKSIQYHTDPLL